MKVLSLLDVLEAERARALAAEATKVDEGALVINVMDAPFNAAGDWNGTTGTDDKAAIDAALAAAATTPRAMVIFPPKKNFLTSGDHVPSRGTVIVAYGSSITHNGNNTCFSFNSTGGFEVANRSAVLGMRLSGNNGASAVGIEWGNQWGFTLHDSFVRDYTAGSALLLNNVTNWTEGTDVLNVMIRNSATGIRFAKSTGTISFAYTQFRNFAISVPADGVGIDLGATSSGQCYLYNAVIEGSIWLEGNNAVGVKMGPNTSVDTTRFAINGEIMNSSTGVANISGSGGAIKGFGTLQIKSAPNNLTGGASVRILASYRPQDTVSGVNGGETFQTLATNNPDTAHDAQFGYVSGSNLSTPYVAAYDQNDGFRVYKVTNGGTVAANGTLLFKVNNNGEIVWGGTNNLVNRARTGTPDGAVNSNPGAFYMQTDGGANRVLWFKDSGTGNTGWRPVALSGITRPKTAAYTCTSYDGQINADASGGAFTLAMAPSVVGQQIGITKMDGSANAVTISLPSGSTFVHNNAQTMTLTSLGQHAELRCITTTKWVLL